MVWASSLVIAHKYAHFLFGWITFLIVTYGWITCQGMCKGKLESFLQVVISVLQACCSKMLCITRGLAGPLVSLSWLWLGPSDSANWPYGGRLRVLEALQVAD